MCTGWGGAGVIDTEIDWLGVIHVVGNSRERGKSNDDYAIICNKGGFGIYLVEMILQQLCIVKGG